MLKISIFYTTEKVQNLCSCIEKKPLYCSPSDDSGLPELHPYAASDDRYITTKITFRNCCCCVHVVFVVVVVVRVVVVGLCCSCCSCCVVHVVVVFVVGLCCSCCSCCCSYFYCFCCCCCSCCCCYCCQQIERENNLTLPHARPTKLICPLGFQKEL